MIAAVERKYPMLATIVALDLNCTANTQQKLCATTVRVIAALGAERCNDCKNPLDDKRHLRTHFQHDKRAIVSIIVWQVDPPNLLDSWVI
jgi:hypothetical protein